MNVHPDLIADATGHRSPRLIALGVPHVFGTRRHNVQSADDARALADAAGLPPGPVHLGTQCHGRGVSTPETRSTPGSHNVPADAHLTTHADKLVAVRTADCVPVLLASIDGCCVAAVHAGWRGLIAGVIEAAADAMRQRGSAPAAAAVGPCIDVDAYEIGPEVASLFASEHLVRHASARPHLDLRRATTARLLGSGLAAGNIDVSTACTHRDESDFFSYRRATQRGAERGHQATLIAPATT